MRYFIWHCIRFHLQYIPICSNRVLQALDRLKILVRLDAWVWADLWMSQGGLEGAKWPRKLRTLSWLSRLELPGCLPENTGSGRAWTSQERWGSGMQRMQTDAKTTTFFKSLFFLSYFYLPDSEGLLADRHFARFTFPDLHQSRFIDYRFYNDFISFSDSYRPLYFTRLVHGPISDRALGWPGMLQLWRAWKTQQAPQPSWKLSRFHATQVVFWIHLRRSSTNS